MRFLIVEEDGSFCLESHFKAIHNFDVDTVTIQTVQDSMVLHNSVGLVKVTPKGTSPVHSAKQQENSVGGSSSANPPSRQVLYINILEPLIWNDESSFISDCVDSTAEATDYGIGEVYEDIEERKREH